MTDLPCRLREIVEAMPGKTASAIHCRRDGVPASVLYPQCHRDALAVAAALRNHGVGPGDRVAIHGETSYEWVLADLGCVVSEAISVALYPSAPVGRAAATAVASRCRVVFTDKAEYVAGFREAGLEVIFLGGGGPAGVPSMGGLLRPADAAPVATGPAASGPFTIVSTSGTLSEPKLFAVHSAPLLYTMDRFAEIYGFGGEDRLLLYLPLSHLPQRMMLYWGLGAGMDFVLSDPAHFPADTQKLSPTLHVAVPRSLQHLHWRVAEMLQRNGGAAPGAYGAVFGPSIKAIFVGSAPTEPAIIQDLLAAGLPVYEVYGTTELGMIALNTPGATRVGTVGRPIPWGRVRLDPTTSEILVRTPTPFMYGRLVDGEIAPEAWEADAWQPTGDVGSVDQDGYLTVRGRLREFLALSSGEKIFVRPIEHAVVKTTGAAECVLTTTGASHLGALLFFDPTCAVAARACQVQLDQLNKTLHPWERIRQFAVVARLPSIEEGSVTETMKLRRHKIEEIYGRTATWHPVH